MQVKGNEALVVLISLAAIQYMTRVLPDLCQPGDRGKQQWQPLPLMLQPQAQVDELLQGGQGAPQAVEVRQGPIHLNVSQDETLHTMRQVFTSLVHQGFLACRFIFLSIGPLHQKSCR